MKQFIYILGLLLICTACEDVVDVDLRESEKRLVINASLNWMRLYPGNNMTSGSAQRINLSLTSGYYDDIDAATGAMVKVTDQNTSEVFVFVEQSNGDYVNNTFKPVLGHTYALEISYDGETYHATETLIDAPVINRIEQVRGGFFDEDEIVVKMYYNDVADVDNYYYFDYTTSISNINELSISSDKFTDGNETYEQFSYNGDKDKDEIEIGDTFYIKFYEINKGNYQYLNVLLDQIYNSGIFSPIPAEVRGNVKNLTNEAHYPYGYFRINVGNYAEVTINENELIDN